MHNDGNRPDMGLTLERHHRPWLYRQWVSLSLSMALTVVNGKLNYLSYFPAERIGHAVFVIATLDGEAVRRDIHRAVGVQVAIALVTANRRSCYNRYWKFGQNGGHFSGLREVTDFFLILPRDFTYVPRTE